MIYLVCFALSLEGKPMPNHQRASRNKFQFIFASSIASCLFVGCGVEVSTPLPLIDESGGIPGVIQLNGMAGNGAVVVGTNSVPDDLARRKQTNDLSFAPPPMYAVRWTPTIGYQRLKDADGNDRTETQAVAASADGSVIVGRANYGDSASFIWRATTGMLPMPIDPELMRRNWAEDVSADGNTIVGRVQLKSNNVTVAFHWSPLTGYQTFQPDTDDFRECKAIAVSNNGRVVLGTYSDSERQNRFFLWTQQDGVSEALPPMVEGGKYVAFDLSGDGLTVVGHFYPDDDSTARAFRWTQAAGFIELPSDPELGSITYATATSFDGRRIVGYNATENGSEAIIWEIDGSVRTVRSALSEEDISKFEGLELNFPWGISDDGTTIFGLGRDSTDMQSSWIVTID
jgi:uncharacterized membrane protein